MLKKVFIVFCCASLLLGLSSCGKKDVKEKSIDVFAMDTYMTLKVSSENPDKVLKEAEDEIKRLDAMFSIGNKDSEVSILNTNGSEILGKESDYLFLKSKKINELTDGAFDITVFPLMEKWGFTSGKYRVPADATIAKLLKNVGMNHIKYDKKTHLISVDDGCKIDFGGIAKGYTSEQIMKIYRKHNVKGGIVSLGGNVETCGLKKDGSKYKVGVENPFGKKEYVGILELKDRAVITSGGYERFFEKNGQKYHHIIDPSSGKPARSDLASVTVVGSDGTMGDGLSTALFVMGREKALKFWKKNGKKLDFDLILVTNDEKVTVTEGIENIFSSDNNYQVVR